MRDETSPFFTSFRRLMISSHGGVDGLSCGLANICARCVYICVGDACRDIICCVISCGCIFVASCECIFVIICG